MLKLVKEKKFIYFIYVKLQLILHLSNVLVPKAAITVATSLFFHFCEVNITITRI